MNITADAVRQLRERTGAGMMECKKALVETKGDLDAAAELMRRQGLAKADKKATRVAAEGVIVIERSADARAAAMVEINCETDFVARGDDFRAFAKAVGEAALKARAAELAVLLETRLGSGESVEERRRGGRRGGRGGAGGHAARRGAGRGAGRRQGGGRGPRAGSGGGRRADQAALCRHPGRAGGGRGALPGLPARHVHRQIPRELR